MDPRTHRIAENESRFREINERLRGDLRALPGDPGAVEFICECGRTECGVPVRLTLDEYEDVRANALDFAVAPGHQAPDVEDVVALTERFARVRKHDEAAAHVRARDPRG